VKSLIGILFSFLFVMSSVQGHATCTTLASGATESQLQSAANSCAANGGGAVNLAPGVYGPFTSNFFLPCGVSLLGSAVPYSQSHNQTAILQGSAGFVGQPIHITAGCSSVQSIQFLEWDGKHPATRGGGGGFIYVPAGANHLVISQNFIHGMTAPSSDSFGDQNTQANGIFLDGSGTAPMTQNVSITLNEFGTESYQGDCGGAMTEQNTEKGGGFCNGVGIHAQTNNVSVDRNIFQYLEQGAKSYEGNNGNPANGGGNDNNFSLSYNTFRMIQRIPFETQANLTVGNSRNPTLQYIQFNSFGNRYPGNGGQQNYEVSMANGCGNSGNPLHQCAGHLDYNLFVENVKNPVHSAGNEVWGDDDTTANGNLFEGYVGGAGGAIDWSQNGNFTFNNNIFNMNSGSGTNCATQGGGYWNNEGGNRPAHAPKSCAGNTYSNTGSGTYPSAMPSISPQSGLFNGLQAVTFSNPDSGRDTNTGIWYTTDGSIPVPGAGTAKYIASGGSIQIGNTAKVQAVGMWGAQNQPTSYPAGYGYVPSVVVSQSYTQTGTPVAPLQPTVPVVPVVSSVPPVLKDAYLATPNNVNQMVTGATQRFSAMGDYSSGPTPSVIPNAQVAWTTSNPAVLSVDAAGSVSAVGAGTASVGIKIGALIGSSWTVKVSAAGAGLPKFPVSESLSPGTYTLTISPTGGVTVTQ
jgi:hypothetical protein